MTTVANVPSSTGNGGTCFLRRPVRSRSVGGVLRILPEPTPSHRPLQNGMRDLSDRASGPSLAVARVPPSACSSTDTPSPYTVAEPFSLFLPNEDNPSDPSNTLQTNASIRSNTGRTRRHNPEGSLERALPVALRFELVHDQVSARLAGDRSCLSFSAGPRPWCGLRRSSPMPGGSPPRKPHACQWMLEGLIETSALGVEPHWPEPGLPREDSTSAKRSSIKPLSCEQTRR